MTLSNLTIATGFLSLTVCWPIPNFIHHHKAVSRDRKKLAESSQSMPPTDCIETLVIDPPIIPILASDHVSRHIQVVHRQSSHKPEFLCLFLPIMGEIP
jgi:hypothetical protein